MTMNCACKNFASLVAVRVLLGIFESAVAPSLLLVTGMWYKKEEQPVRIGIWYLGTGTGTIVGALSSYGFQHYTGDSFKSWQVMFLVFGLITIAVGITVTIILPDNPMTCKFLTHAEKVYVVERLRSNQTGIENKQFKVSQMVECLKDPHTWMLSFITVSSNVSNGAVSSFQATIIKGFVLPIHQIISIHHSTNNYTVSATHPNNQPSSPSPAASSPSSPSSPQPT